MYYVYLIKSKKTGLLYIGSTANLDRRITEHNSGKNPSTKKHVPFQLVYYEVYSDEKDATEREYKLKHHGSTIGHLKKRLKRSLNK